MEYNINQEIIEEQEDITVPGDGIDEVSDTMLPLEENPFDDGIASRLWQLYQTDNDEEIVKRALNVGKIDIEQFRTITKQDPSQGGCKETIIHRMARKSKTHDDVMFDHDHMLMDNSHTIMGIQVDNMDVFDMMMTMQMKIIELEAKIK